MNLLTNLYYSSISIFLYKYTYKNKILHMVQLTSSSRDYLETHYMFKLSSFKN